MNARFFAVAAIVALVALLAVVQITDGRDGYFFLSGAALGVLVGIAVSRLDGEP